MSIILAVTVALAGASPVPAAPPPPCTASEYHQWDFWLGAWRVTDPKGVPQGSSRVVSAPGGCGIEEHWTSASGGTGESFNAYDPVRRTWTQFWSGNGEVIRLEGRLDEHGAMQLKGTLANRTGGPEHTFTGAWTPLPDGAVKQEFQDQDPATKTWSIWFVGIYRRAT